MPAGAIARPDATTASPARGAVLPTDADRRVSDTATERVVVLYRDHGLTSSEVQALVQEGAITDSIEVRRPNLVVVETPKGRGRALAGRLRSRPGVAAAARVGTIRALESVPPNDVHYPYDQGTYVGQQSYLGADAMYPYSIDMEPVWNAIFNTDQYAAEPDRAGVPIAVVDSGYTAPLMEYTDRVVPVWNYVDDNTNTLDSFSARHGTRVTGIIGTGTNNAYATAGVLHSIKSPIRIYKVLDSTGSGTSEDTMIAMMDAADQGAKIINTSLGEPAVLDWPTSSDDTSYDLSPDTHLRALWDEVVDYCSSKGTVVVAASGNYANDTWANGDVYTDVLYPAACDGALAVGSINPLTGATSTFSSYGSSLSLMAAGEGVWTTSSTGTSSNSAPGTSYAAPLVSGALASLWSLVPQMSATQVKSLATSTADSSLEEPGYDLLTGYGRFDAGAFYQAMKSSLSVQPTLARPAFTPAAGTETTLTWSPAQGSGVRYRYGYEGGLSYLTTATSGRLVLPSDGEHTVWVRAYASDRFDSLEAATTTISIDTGLPPLSSERCEGDNRYETATAISRAAFPAGAPAVVIASGQNWPDGLTASVLARTVGGPLLLTRTTSLPASTRDEIVRLNPQSIYLIGGHVAISAGTESSIRNLSGVSYTVERFGGEDRYATAELVSAKVNELGGAWGNRAVIASGQNYADALSGSPLAARAGWPVLLVRKDTIPDSTASALSDLGITSTLVLGGTNAISTSVESALPGPTRLFGSDRYATSRAIADYVQKQYASSTIGIARGMTFPDALAAGPLLATDSAPLVLSDGTTPALSAWLAAHGPSTSGIVLFGGSSAIPYNLEFDIRSSLRQ
ncbi:MAG: hypothetical protein CVT69_02130 [Actinobacteria bacterium HGW-Actinobacteria-9]|nr:MAG: hypothetical protein CVT69_02130 [Actinobacteria bacterium HGW-Actinobacteria-9]